jgi:hypothetical protein
MIVLNKWMRWNGIIHSAQPEVIMSGIILLSVIAAIAIAGSFAAIRTTLRDGYRRVPTRRA